MIFEEKDDCPTQEMADRPWYKLRAENEMLRLRIEELERKIETMKEVSRLIPQLYIDEFGPNEWDVRWDGYWLGQRLEKASAYRLMARLGQLLGTPCKSEVSQVSQVNSETEILSNPSHRFKRIMR